MPTRGRFVCHVHCLVHDGVVQSSPCGAHHENFGRNLYHMFVSGLFCKPNPLFCFELWYSSFFNVKCWFHTFSKQCSHISMGVLILSIIEIFLSILFNRHASLQVDLIIFNIRKIISKFSQWCLFHPYQVAFVFPTLPPFSSRTHIF